MDRGPPPPGGFTMDAFRGIYLLDTYDVYSLDDVSMLSLLAKRRMFLRTHFVRLNRKMKRHLSRRFLSTTVRSLSLFPSVPASLSVFLALSDCLPLSVCLLSWFLPLSVSVSVSTSVSVCLYLSFSLSLSLSFPFSVSLFLSIIYIYIYKFSGALSLPSSACQFNLSFCLYLYLIPLLPICI